MACPGGQASRSHAIASAHFSNQPNEVGDRCPCPASALASGRSELSRALGGAESATMKSLGETAEASANFASIESHWEEEGRLTPKI